MKPIKVIFVIVIMLIILIPVLNFDFTQNKISEIDNRILTEFPLGGNDKSDLSKSIDNYLTDRIGMRNSAIYYYTKINDLAFDEMIHPTYTYGENGQVFFKMPNDFVDSLWMEEFTTYLAKVQSYCMDRNIPFFYCINPSKTTVYNEFLPDGYNYSDRSTKLLKQKLEEKNVRYIDNTAMLVDKHLQEDVFNKQYDAGHWNDLGAFYGTNEILKEVKKDCPDVKVNELDDFVISQTHVDSLLVSKFDIDENVPVFENKRENNIQHLHDYDNLKINKQHNHFDYTYNLDADDNLPKVLFFQGSYLNSRTKFMESNFKEYISIHNYENLLDFTYYFNLFQPDYVIVESTEYATNASYFNYEKMRQTNLNSKLNITEIDNANEVTNEIGLSYHTQNAIINLMLSDDIDSTGDIYLVSNQKVFDFAKDTRSLSLSSNDFSIDDCYLIVKESKDDITKFSNLVITIAN